VTVRGSLANVLRRVRAFAPNLTPLIVAVALIGWTIALRCAVTVLSATSSIGPSFVQNAGPGNWTIVPQAGGDLGVTFSLGWTLGTHQGRASRVTGSLDAQIEPLAVTQGEFRVPIAAMSTGSTTRDCHMREALGIDYARSRFPAEHVCANDQVPASGPDSVVYPDIVIKVQGMRPAQGAASGPALRLTPMQWVDTQVSFGLSMHGTTRDMSAPMRLQLIKPDVVQVQMEFEVKLADFGLVVKMPALMKVEDRAKVKLNLLLGRSSD
jgi:polyisoprenoid-binding protein YceI